MNVNKCTEEVSSSLSVAGSKKPISNWFFSCFLMKANFFSRALACYCRQLGEGGMKRKSGCHH